MLIKVLKTGKNYISLMRIALLSKLNQLLKRHIPERFTTLMFRMMLFWFVVVVAGRCGAGIQIAGLLLMRLILRAGSLGGCIVLMGVGIIFNLLQVQLAQQII